MSEPKSKSKKTYLDMYLENLDGPKKKPKYDFRDKQQQAILEYNDPNTSPSRRRVLYVDIIKPGFDNIVKGVLAMRQFHKLPPSMDREQLIDDLNFRLIDKIDRFLPTMLGANGMPVKAFSYFSTIAKNYILEKIFRHEKVLMNKADVETSIDLSILSEDTLKMMSNYDKQDVLLDDYETTFNNTRQIILSAIREVIVNEEAKPKKDKDLIDIGHILIYILEKWNKIDFMKKNEFMRILTLYTGLKQQQVSFQFKKYKTAVFKKLRPNPVSKSKRAKDDDDMLDSLDIFDLDQEDSPQEEENKRFKYAANTMEEFEIQIELDQNDKVKARREKNKK
jgi:hypothetical protein